MPATVVTDATWEDQVLRHPGVVLVDVRSSWFTTCEGFSSLLQELGVEHPEVAVRHLDVDENPATRRQYGVTSVPTLLVLRDGSLVRRLVGTRQPQQLQRELAAYLPDRRPTADRPHH
jgi:thioredoxin 1